MARTTLNDLAADLGLSANTVSRALSGKDGVSTRTRARVLDEARRTGYVVVPDAARAGDRRDRRTLAVTIPSATHQFSAELIGAVEDGARAAGYALDLFATGEDAEQEARIASSVATAQVAGAIVIPVGGRAERADRAGPWAAPIAAGMPVVSVSRELAGVDLVAADNEHGAYAATRHLLGQGCRRLLQVEEDLPISTIDARRRGFARALAEVPDADAEVVAVPTRRYESADGRWRPAEAYRSCLAVLDRGGGVDAVCAGDDLFALGVLRALTERGLRVPDDVRLIGYGDHPHAAWLSPSLSTVRIPTTLIGELAAALLLQRIADGAGGSTPEPIRRIVKPELVVRESSTRRPG